MAMAPLMEILRDNARLAALKKTALMGSGADPAFDRLTHLAIKLMKTPVALVSLVDDERQYFKSCVGLPEPWKTQRETDLDHSFCKHVVHTGQPLAIADARQDPQFKDNLAIRDLGVVAYLGIPLLTSEGHVLGSCCVIDGMPRLWKSEDIATLKEIASLVLTEIELRIEIAERKMAEERLRRAFEDLDRRVSERTAEVLALNFQLEGRVQERTTQLEVANRDLEAFAYSVSHDLKAPLWAISGFSEILVGDHRDKLDADAQRYLDLILQSTVRMSRLIDDLLSYARLGQKAVHLQPLDLNLVLEQVLEPFAVRIREKCAEIRLPERLPVMVSDRAMLQQILGNLLDNALKYQKKDVPPKIEIGVQDEGDSILFRVSDNGIGVPEKFREQIFNVFKRLHTEKEYPGTGVGLALVRKAAQLLGGKVWVESYGDGSLFCVRLPKK